MPYLNEYEGDYKITSILLVILCAGIFILLDGQKYVREAYNGFLIIYTLITFK